MALKVNYQHTPTTTLCKGVSPWLFFALTSAFFAINRLNDSSQLGFLNLAQKVCKGVLSSILRASTRIAWLKFKFYFAKVMK